MIVEKWKDTPTTKIQEIKKSAKRLVMLNTEWMMFYLFLIIFMSPTIVVTLTRSYNRDFTFFVVNFVAYFFVWIFYLKNKIIDKNQKEDAQDRVSEMDIVLNNR